MAKYFWYKNAVFYEIYLRSFKDGNHDGIGDIIGLISKVEYLKDLGVDCIWLLPIYPSPRNDDGYDISNFYSIDEEYGTLDDFKTLIQKLHGYGIRIIMDLVVNHTSNQHPWFLSAREDRNSPYRDYYVWSDSNDLFKDVRIIFSDTEESNWTWDEKAKQYYWHRFYSSQPDLNYQNPKVRAEMLEVIRFWMEFGIDGLRVDAVPYLFEREGTNCENLPETHAYLKTMRGFVDENFKDKILICEANQPQDEVVKYFGNNDEFHMAFNFPLMPYIFMALKNEDSEPIINVMSKTPEIPSGCHWGNFLRNHDELSLEMVTPTEREWMWEQYAPDPGMRLNLGIRRRLAPLLDNDQRKIELAFNILFSVPGSPFIYYGDEIGLGDEITLPDRDGVRLPMSWNLVSQQSPLIQMKTGSNNPALHDIHDNFSSVEDQVLNKNSLWYSVRKLIGIRKNQKVFLSRKITFFDTGEKKFLCYHRNHEDEHILFINNLGSTANEFTFSSRLIFGNKMVDLLTRKKILVNRTDQSISLLPFQSLFLKF